MSPVTMRLFRSALLALAALLLAAALPASGQPPDPPFMQDLFPPDVIMRHQRDIGLSDAQRDAITAAVQRTQAAVVELQWKLQDAGRSLTDLMQQTPIDEKAALATAEELMRLEGEVKRAHLGLLIQIRNGLSAQQVEQLKALRNDR